MKFPGLSDSSNGLSGSSPGGGKPIDPLEGWAVKCRPSNEKVSWGELIGLDFGCRRFNDVESDR